jgi:flagellin
MGFKINTNIAAMNSHQLGTLNNRSLDNSLSKLSSGLRINKAADDASGMAIADGLRLQANSLGQSIRNANDGIGIIQTADKAMDEQIKIMDTIKTKATQAAQDGQNETSRKAIQRDIVRLLEELDNIAETTSFNGMALLSGQFTNKKFQIGANSNETVTAHIGATSSDKVGHTRFETGINVSASGEVKLTFKDTDGVRDVTLESVVISNSAGTGLGVLVETINKNSDKLGGIKANWHVQTTGHSPIASATSIDNLQINGIMIGTVVDIKENDKDGKLVNAINALTDKHGIIASIDERGHFNLTSTDGRGIKVEASMDTISAGTYAGSTNVNGSTFSAGTYASTGKNSQLDALGLVIVSSVSTSENYGRLSLTKLDGNDIITTGTGLTNVGFDGNESEATVNLRKIVGAFSKTEAEAMGMFANHQVSDYSAAMTDGQIGVGVTTLTGAMAVMSIADTATKYLDRIRSDLGSVQNQLTVTINNISVTEVNLRASESQIRDVDFAAESATFQKHNLLAQSGSYAMSQSNQIQQHVMKLLQ